MVKFDAKPPIVGKASQWTNKAWKIVDEVGKSSFKDILHIPFNAKNYDTNNVMCPVSIKNSIARISDYWVAYKTEDTNGKKCRSKKHGNGFLIHISKFGC